ncbi:MAG: ParB/RepB/Spo0J family partition protein [Ignavibacteriae bacterium]|nr:ParB/RepB/Spo0J family partition protein [Ignavibacteria bacterium]MBI3364430.1 ParB/RepB/Spo0J family partition protein [Ignavibacteriota bacterium]
MSKVKGGLGKGLSALIRPVAEQEIQSSQARVSSQPGSVPAADSVMHIEIAKIRPNPFQPRADFDQQALDELKESIRQKGIIQAVTVRRAGDGMYDLISGERRIRASQELGLTAIPAYILDVRTESEMLELALIENLQREHLNSIEIAISYQRLMHDVGLSAEDIAQKVSKDRTTVVNFLRLLKLPTTIQDALRKGRLTMGHARALVGIPDDRVQLKLFEQIVKKDLNVRQVEKLVRDVGKKAHKKISPRPRTAGSAIDDLAQRMQQILATRVKVNVHDGDKGEIMIEFYSTDDLGRLFDLISSIER